MPDEQICSGFMAGGQSDDLFRGTAAYYARYRRLYPIPLVLQIVLELGLNGHGRLLDAGCGTGQVFQVFSQYFEEVVAIDRDQAMVRHALKAVGELGLTNVKVLRMPAEEIDDHLGFFRTVIFGASFHWMDRVRIANLVHDILEPRGHLIALSPGGIHSGTTAWEAELRDVLASWLGVDRRAGGGFYREGERHEQVLAKTRFREIAVKHVQVSEQWSLDEIVGYLFSTSYASPVVLGDKKDSFEHAVRQRLLRIKPDGKFGKIVEYSVIIARRVN